MIEGKLVDLRPFEMSDLDDDWRWVNDREFTRYVSMRYPVPRLAEEEWLRARTSQFPAYGEQRFAIETKDGRHIGNCSLFDVRPADRVAELGIGIGEKDCWSRGYGTDAVITLTRWGFEEMDLRRVFLTVYDFNVRGRKAYAKAGFVEEGCLRKAIYREGRRVDLVIMGALRDEFFALHGAPAAAVEEVTR
jgi:RimJ/RimL family protein N-acetyltransferase